jgi:hypothetical protein
MRWVPPRETPRSIAPHLRWALALKGARGPLAAGVADAGQGVESRSASFLLTQTTSSTLPPFSRPTAKSPAIQFTWVATNLKESESQSSRLRAQGPHRLRHPYTCTRWKPHRNPQRPCRNPKMCIMAQTGRRWMLAARVTRLGALFRIVLTCASVDQAELAAADSSNPRTPDANTSTDATSLDGGIRRLARLGHSQDDVPGFNPS